MEQNKQTNRTYLGSVRFFRHLILGVVGLMVAVPTVLCAVFAFKYFSLSAMAAEYEAPPEPPALSTEEPEPVQAPPPVEFPPWQALYPELYAPAMARGTVDEEEMVYLTFDDGPSLQTPKVLEILEQYGVKATFFVVGREDAQSAQWLRDIVAAGHALGVHTYSHDYKEIYASVENYLADFERMYRLIEETTGVAPTIFRFPGGSINGYNATTYENIISEMVRRGFVYFDWNVATGDAASNAGMVPAQALVANALSNAANLRRAVILMHDSGGKTTTVEALPAIIEGYQQAGFTFGTLTGEVVPVAYKYPK